MINFFITFMVVVVVNILIGDVSSYIPSNFPGNNNNLCHCYAQYQCSCLPNTPQPVAPPTIAPPPNKYATYYYGCQPFCQPQKAIAPPTPVSNQPYVYIEPSQVHECQSKNTVTCLIYENDGYKEKKKSETNLETKLLLHLLMAYANKERNNQQQVYLTTQAPKLCCGPTTPKLHCLLLPACEVVERDDYFQMKITKNDAFNYLKEGICKFGLNMMECDQEKMKKWFLSSAVPLQRMV